MTTIKRIVRTLVNYREATIELTAAGGLAVFLAVNGSLIPIPAAPASPTFRALPPFTSTTTVPPTTLAPSPSSVPAGPAGVRPPSGQGPAGTIPPTTTMLPPVTATTMPPPMTVGFVCTRPGPPTAPTHATWRGPPLMTVTPDRRLLCVPRKD